MAKITLKNLLAVMAGLTIVAPTSVGILVNVNSTAVKNKITNQELTAEINQTTYQTIIYLKTEITVEKVEKQITAQFIQQQLKGNFNASFKPNLFTFKKITVRQRNLDQNDLEHFGIIDAEINYDYGSISNQKTKLIIDKKILDQDIVSEIQAAAFYTKTINVSENNSAKAFMKEINSKFIQTPLSDDAKQAIKDQLFTVNDITINGRSLVNDDLRKVQGYFSILNFNYGRVLNQEIPLIIRVI